MPFSLRCRRRKFCANFATQKSTKGASNGVPEWLPLGPFLSDVSVLRCDIGLRCRVYINPGVWAPIFCKGTYPSIPPMIMLQRAIKSLKCIKNFTWSTIHRLSTVATVLLMNFWFCKLANLRNQKSFSCADVGLRPTPAFSVFTSSTIDQGRRSLGSHRTPRLTTWGHGAAEVPSAYSSSCPAFVSAAPMGSRSGDRYDHSAERRLR